MAKALKLRRKEVPYEEIQVGVRQLAFYPENPRIYSHFAGSRERTQENIQAKLESMDHVKDLRSQIDRDGQVNEPLFCIGVAPESELHGHYEYQVLEGNSRLAALRMNKKGSLPPPRVACNVLDFSAYSEQETESLIFSLLGGFHITGKTNWQSYENAAYIYRRFKNQEVPIEDIAKEIPSLSPSKVRQMVIAFQMMIDAGDDNTSRWSYYEAYASSTKLKNHRQNIPGLDDRVVELIKEDKFPRALDMRTSCRTSCVTRGLAGYFLTRRRRNLSRKPSRLRISAATRTQPLSGYNGFAMTWRPARRGARSPSYCGATAPGAGLNTS